MTNFLWGILIFIGSLFIAGLGSGIWEKVQKPILEWVARMMARFFKSWYDGLYKRASARPLHESTGYFLTLVACIPLILLTPLISTLIGGTLTPYLVQKEAVIRSSAATNENAEKALVEYRKDATLKSHIIVALAGIIYSAIGFYIAFVHITVAGIINRFDHLIAKGVCVLPERSVKLFHSRFATMISVSEYIEILTDLKKRTKEEFAAMEKWAAENPEPSKLDDKSKAP